MTYRKNDVHEQVVGHEADKDESGVVGQSRLRKRNGIENCEHCQ